MRSAVASNILVSDYDKATKLAKEFNISIVDVTLSCLRQIVLSHSPLTSPSHSLIQPAFSTLLSSLPSSEMALTSELLQFLATTLPQENGKCSDIDSSIHAMVVVSVACLLCNVQFSFPSNSSERKASRLWFPPSPLSAKLLLYALQHSEVLPTFYDLRI